MLGFVLYILILGQPSVSLNVYGDVQSCIHDSIVLQEFIEEVGEPHLPFSVHCVPVQVEDGYANR